MIDETNSYVQLDSFELFLESRGLVQTEPELTPSQALLRAMDFVESKDFRGVKKDPAQELEWPRTGFGFPKGFIPADIYQAQRLAAVAYYTGVSLGETDAPAVKSETVDVISVTYQDRSKGFEIDRRPERLLKKYTYSAGGANTVRLKRCL